MERMKKHKQHHPYQKKQRKASDCVVSAYNFIPALPESFVFKPAWADQISHDIPFKDGESGEIEFEIEAVTPIFIRNGTGQDQNASDEFCHIVVQGEKRYFIPATSLKGMLRNVLEILTCCRLHPVSDRRFAYRDLTPGHPYMHNFNQNNVRCGFLFEKDGQWFIEDYGKPHFITHKEVDKILGTELHNMVRNRKEVQKLKHAFDKYKLKGGPYAVFKESKGVRFATFTNKNNKKMAKKTDDPNGREGYIVFTGQPGVRNDARNTGKATEFVFLKPEGHSKPKVLPVSPEVKSDFLNIYYDHDDNQINPDWKEWRKYLENGEKVPVFFTPDESGDGVLHMGLAYMYKLPYNSRIHGLYPLNTYPDPKSEEWKFDLAEVIFGSINGTDPLKGRVFFSHAFAIGNPQTADKVDTILGSPKASYYPFYLQQEGEKCKVEEYKTYDDADAELRGFKRYPQKGMTISNTTDLKPEEYNPNVRTQFIPLQKGTTFKGKIRFHNLKPAEIGALLSALTFHNKADQYFHSLGMAKPLGYGAVRIKNVQLKGLRYSDIVYYTNEFEIIMDTNLELIYKANTNQSVVWRDTVQYTEFLRTAAIANHPERLRYPVLKDFQQYKRDKKYLPPHSEFDS